MGKFFPQMLGQRRYPPPITRIQPSQPIQRPKDTPHEEDTLSIPQLSAHPNFVPLSPQPGEDIIAFTLRCAATLISPTKIAGEDEDTPCEVVADAVKQLASFVKACWGQLD
mgnify:CR=1 FL=1